MIFEGLGMRLGGDLGTGLHEGGRGKNLLVRLKYSLILKAGQGYFKITCD